MTSFPASMLCLLPASSAAALAATLLSCASTTTEEEGVPGMARRDPPTSGTRAAEPRAGTASSPDGVEIAYETAGTGDPALVFVHGWSCDRSYWRAQMDHFSATHRVVAIDLGGHGQSGLGRGDWTMAAFAQDVRAVVEALDLRGVVLVGHSMGGPVTVEAAQLMPGRVAAIVPVDFFEDVERRWLAEEIEGFLAPLRADFRTATDGFVRRLFTARADPELVEWVVADMAAAPPEVAISAMESIWRYDQAKGLAAVQVPVRLINADMRTTDVEAARRHRPDLELAVMPGAGHFLMMEEPDGFNRLLADAVRDLVDPR